MYSAGDYHQALLSLLPQGEAWVKEEGCELSNLMLGLAQEFARIDARCKQLSNESLPSQVSELIDEWERDYGLPDGCAQALSTLSDRRKALIEKYQRYGSQSREYLMQVAAALGINIAITEFKPRVFGNPFGEPWIGRDWAFVIDVALLGFDVDSNEALAARLMCVLRKIIHAHKVLVFNLTYTPLTLASNDELQLSNGQYLTLNHALISD